MIELKHKRSYNTDKFLDGDKIVQNIYISPKYYDNYKGFGDGEKGFRKVDKTFINTDGTFKYQFANDNLSCSHTANGVIDFVDLFNKRENNIQFIPVCSDVQGSIIDNQIVYENAFSDGIDLIINPTSTGFQKLVRLRDYELQDYEFKFQLIINGFYANNLKIFRSNGTILDLMSVVQTPIIFNGEQIRIGKTFEDSTVINAPKIWNETSEEFINVELSFENGSFYLTKLISQSQLNGVMFTDTEVSITASNKQGRSGRNTGTLTQAGFEAMRNSSAATSTSTNSTVLNGGCDRTASLIYLDRLLLVFDISSIEGTVTDALIDVKTYSSIANTATGTTGTNYKIGFCQSTLTSSELNNARANSDYDNTDFTLITETRSISTLSTNTRYTYTLTDVTDLNTKIGNGDTYVGYVMQDLHDINNVMPPDASKSSYVYHYMAGSTGNEPKLTVTYSTTTNKQQILD